MESTQCRYMSWRYDFRLHFRGERKLLPEREQRFFNQGRCVWRGRIPALAPEGKELLYLARKKWPTIADDFQLLDQLEGWLSVERQQSEETLQELLLSTVVEWLRHDTGLQQNESATAERTFGELMRAMQEGEIAESKAKHVDDVWWKQRDAAFVCLQWLGVDSLRLEIEARGQAFGVASLKQWRAERCLAMGLASEQLDECELSSIATAIVRESHEEHAGTAELPIDLRPDNQDRTVLELFQFLTLIGQAEAEVLKWRDKAGYNGFRPYHFKHEAEEIPKQLKQSDMMLGLLQENLALWPNIGRLRTVAESEGKNLNAGWFKQWKARRGIELGCFDGIDELLLADVVAARSGTVEPPGERTEANRLSGGDGADALGLPNSQRLAYLAAKYAEAKNERELTDPEAWDWLNDNGIEGAGEIDSYKLPLKDTFADYMNKARRQLGEKRKTQRRGRTGRSIVKQSET